MTETESVTERTHGTMPVLFLGHASPMNAIEENEFVDGFRAIAKKLPKPKAILCVSAHWETEGTRVTAMEQPRTIHDFGGFPAELYAVQYPAPGSPALAREIAAAASTNTMIDSDQSWGLDHGCWSVVKHLYPKADIPIVQLSLDRTRSARRHYDFAKELASFRKNGVLIIGSGNIVHNLGMVAWERPEIGYGFDWATEVQGEVNRLILARDHEKLIDYRSLGKTMALAVPTPEHYLPLLYVLSLQEEADSVTLFNDKPVAGSLTMTSLLLKAAD